MRSIIATACAAACLAFGAPDARAQDDAPIALSIASGTPGPAIDRNIFGQFAEHLGRGIYGGIWVGPGSPIPNVRGIRSDVVAALRALHGPNVRWPGGCYGDEYHWRDGIGPAVARRVRVNASWGNAIEPDTSARTSSWTSPARLARTLGAAARPTLGGRAGDRARSAARPRPRRAARGVRAAPA